jgi:acetyl esterase/lipase
LTVPNGDAIVNNLVTKTSYRCTMRMPEVTPRFPAPPPDDLRSSPLAKLAGAPLPSVVVHPSGVRTIPGAIFAVELGYRPLCLDVHLPPATLGTASSPVVLYVHGGAFLLGDRRSLPPPLERLDLFQRLPLEGFAVASADYRLTGEVRFPGQLHDLKAAIRWLRARSEELGIDPTRIAAWGESAGAHLAALLGTTGAHPETDGSVGLTGPSSSVKAVVDWYGPTDLAAMDRQAPADSAMRHDDPGSPESLLIGAPVQEHPELVRTADPASWAGRSAPPFLIQHGTRDRFVPFGQSVHLDDALRAAGVPSRLMPVVGADHVFEGHADDETLLEPVLAFLREVL